MRILPFKIAFRFLKSNIIQTVLIVVGMAVAISIQVFVGLLISSLQISLINSTVRNSPQITISSNTQVPSLDEWEKIYEIIQRNKLVNAVAPSVSGSAFTVKDKKNIPLLMKGMNIEDSDRIYNLREALYAGDINIGSRDVLIGRQLADELQVGVGDKINLTTSAGTDINLTVEGLYDLGLASINGYWVIASMRTVQQLYNLPDRVTAIEITVGDVFAADNIASGISQELNNKDLKIDNWKVQNSELLSGLRSQDISSSIIQVVIIVSVIIAIGSVLAVTVLQKSRQIGILKAMGISDLDASLIFIYEGFLLGLVGSVLGIALGLGILYVFDKFGGGVVKISIDYNFIIISWMIALVSSTLAGIFPARRSLRLNPIDVIREG
jgi:lipoprotein-releasing system permease protein